MEHYPITGIKMPELQPENEKKVRKLRKEKGIEVSASPKIAAVV